MSGLDRMLDKQARKIEGVVSSINPLLTGDEKKDKNVLRAISYLEKALKHLERIDR